MPGFFCSGDRCRVRYSAQYRSSRRALADRIDCDVRFREVAARHPIRTIALRTSEPTPGTLPRCFESYSREHSYADRTAQVYSPFVTCSHLAVRANRSAGDQQRRQTESEMMKKIALLSIVAAAFLLGGRESCFAAEPNTYQVTGPILELSDTKIAVQKGKERWELARDPSTKATSELKVGDKVTITYTMRAKKIEVKSAGNAGDDAKAGASVSPSPATAPAKR